MSSCLLHLFIKKLNAYEPELATRHIIPEVQEELERKEEAERIQALVDEWKTYMADWVEDGGSPWCVGQSPHIMEIEDDLIMCDKGEMLQQMRLEMIPLD